MAVAIGVASLSGAIGALAQSDAGGEEPEEVLDSDQRGRAALAAIGEEQIADVAEQNDMATAELEEVLREDSSAWIDTTGRLYYVDPEIVEPPSALAADAQAPPASRPLSETFKLHSRPGANRVIYLDFTGFDASGTAWAEGQSDTYAEPWTQDGDPNSFNDSERRLIQEVWRRMAEDFAPFAIDVTTEDPGIEAIRRTDSNDQKYGTRVAFSPNIVRPCQCGGVAYVDVFDVYGRRSSGTYLHDYYQPAWAVARSTSSAKSLAEVGSHEAGHNLSLGHDGTSTVGYYGGHGDWAPIMGVGYRRNITQWSKGEYNDANNSEDDIGRIIAAGAPSMADDHGDTVSTATALTADTVDVSGIISTRNDRDAFAFTTSGGRVTVSVDVVVEGPNLDTSLDLVDGSGKLVASSTSSGLGASIDQAVGAGTYALIVDGVGVGDPRSTGYSDYASLGHFSLSGTIPSGGDPNPSCDGLVREAEDGSLRGGFVRGSDSSASGGGFVWVPSGEAHNYNGADATSSRVDLCFTVAEAGSYRIDTRVLGPTWDADSFYVLIDGAPSGDGYLWDTTRASSYQVDSVSARGGADPLTVSLGAGEHTVSFYLREAGTRLDSATLVKQGGGDPNPSCDGLSSEAEDGSMHGRFVRASDSSASNGGYAWVPAGGAHNYNGADATSSRVALCFDVAEAGSYRIDTRVLGPTWDADSFYVRVDGAPSGDGYLWDTTRASTYQVDPVSARGGADPVVVSLNAGEHTIEFFLREAGTRLDSVTLVKQGGGDPNPSCDGLVREAEDGSLRGGFVRGSDSSASGGGFVWVPSGEAHNYNGADATSSRVDLCFTVAEAGSYRIDTRVLGPTWDADSFYVLIDGAPSGDGYLWDTTRASTYQVDSVSARGGADPLTVSLGAGEHTVSFYLREAGTRLDSATLVKQGGG